MNDTKIAAKLRATVKRFLGKLSPHFSRPKCAFIADMMYGLMAGGDIKLFCIIRGYGPRISMKKSEDRLSFHLAAEGIDVTLQKLIANEVAKRVDRRTLIIVDPSDIQKPYAFQMKFLSKVWDGSRGDVGANLGYYGCMAVVCEDGGRRPLPMHLRFWSPNAPGFKSENEELENVFDTIIEATNGIVPVRLPDIKDKLLHIVVVKGFGQKPMMLLTSLANTTTRKDLWQVVSGYITRWRVEETIRYIKRRVALTLNRYRPVEPAIS